MEKRKVPSIQIQKKVDARIRSYNNYWLILCKYNQFCSIMDKNILNKKPLIPQRLTNNDSQHKTPHSVATKNNENNIIDYKNISLTLTGKLLSQLRYIFYMLLLLIFCNI